MYKLTRLAKKSVPKVGRPNLRFRLLDRARQRGPSVLLDLVTVLPPDLVPRAIEIAKLVENPARRKRLLTALAARLKPGSALGKEPRFKSGLREPKQQIADARALAHLSAATRRKLLTEVISFLEHKLLRKRRLPKAGSRGLPTPLIARPSAGRESSAPARSSRWPGP